VDILLTGIARIVLLRIVLSMRRKSRRGLFRILFVRINSRAVVEWHFVDMALYSADWEASHSIDREDG
jgi:hypothetical protein